MNAPLARLVAIIVFAFPTASRSDEVEKAGEKPKLVTRVYKVPPWVVGVPSAGLKNEDPKIKIRKLPPTADGEMRYDVWNFLEMQGVERTPGAEAIFLEGSSALVFTGSPEMQDLVERMMGGEGCCFGPVHHVEITANLWEYQDDQFADAARGLRQFADIRKRAGDSLRLLDSQLILTKSGQRATAINKEASAVRAPVAAPDAKPAGSASTDTEPRFKLNGARGSALEVEPTIGPDGVLVDMQIGYEARFRQVGGAQDTEVDVMTNVTLASNHDAIPYCALAHDDGLPAKNGGVRRRALVIGVRVIDVEGLSREESEKQRKKEDEQLIRKARSGLGAPGK